ncbi:G-protein coupled receptor 55-like [Amblyraja radiata]|uniref:G-protein coupled receptor 55-like n=1 Tax=Amblyraja radiata TaxID=386614 RepID=UPI001403A326|nr:G-protein coupled receptor 55-like [Amblyraja radiata]
MCSRNNTTDSEFVKTFQYVVHIPTFALGLVINSTALWILCFRLKNWTESMIYMTNLIFSDLLLLFSLPFKMHAFQKSGEWHLGPRFCEFVESLYFVNTYGTILLIMLISLDRYIAIRYPILARTLRSPQKAAVACTVLWLCVWSASIPNYFQKSPTTHQCFMGFDEFWKRADIPLTMLALFAIAALAVIFCSVRIIRTLRRVVEEREEINMSTSMKIISSNLVTFLLCFTPYHVAMLLYLLARKCYMPVEYQAPLRVFLQVSQCLATTNCCLDAMYYYLIIKEFWKSKHRIIP